jgi:hypothetical protein
MRTNCVVYLAYLYFYTCTVNKSWAQCASKEWMLLFEPCTKVMHICVWTFKDPIKVVSAKCFEKISLFLFVCLCFVYFVSLFFFMVPTLFGYFLSFHSLHICELASIMGESSHYFWVCNRDSVCWLMFDIDLHPVLWKSHWGSLVVSHWHICCCWWSMNIQETLTILHTTCLFYSASFQFPLPCLFIPQLAVMVF